VPIVSLMSGTTLIGLVIFLFGKYRVGRSPPPRVAGEGW
jgi:hypothetical protein